MESKPLANARRTVRRVRQAERRRHGTLQRARTALADALTPDALSGRVGRFDDPRQIEMFGRDPDCVDCGNGVLLGVELRPVCARCKRRVIACRRHEDCDLADALARGRCVSHCGIDDACDECRAP